MKIAVSAVLLFGFYCAGELFFRGYNIEYGYLKMGFASVWRMAESEKALFVYLSVLVLPAVLLLAGVLNGMRESDRLFELSGRIIKSRGFFYAVPALFLVLTLLTRFYVIRDMPLTDDEQAYIFTSKTLLAGKLYLKSPPGKEFFDNVSIINNGKWYSRYPIGFPLLMAPFVAAGLGSLFNPLCSTLILIIFMLVARRLYGRGGAALTGILLLTSPFFFYTSTTMLAQPAATLGVALTVYSLIRIYADEWSAINTSLTCLGLGTLLFTRPFTAVAIELPAAGVFVYRALKQKRYFHLVQFVLAGTGFVFLFCLVNYLQNGNALKMAYHTYMEFLGRQTGLLIFPFPTTELAFANLGLNLVRLNYYLLGWPISIFPVLLIRNTRENVLFLLMCCLTLFLHLFYLTPGLNVTGPVHLAEIVPLLVLLIVSGILNIGENLKEYRKLVAFTVGLLVAVNILLFFPIMGRSLHRAAGVIKKPYEKVKEAGLKNAVVFVKNIVPEFRDRDLTPDLPFVILDDENHRATVVPTPGTECWKFSTWVRSHRNNSPDLGDDVLFVKDLGDRNRELMRLLPDRKGYTLEVDDTGEVIIKELPADEARSGP